MEIKQCRHFATHQSYFFINTLQWRHIGRDGVSNHQPHDCLLNRLFRRRSKKASRLRGEFPAQMASYAENASIWWRHHETRKGAAHPRMLQSNHSTTLNNRSSIKSVQLHNLWDRCLNIGYLPPIASRKLVLSSHCLNVQTINLLPLYMDV